MNYFEQLFEEMAENLDKTVIRWWRPGMTMEEAYESIRALPIDPEYGIENPTQPEQEGWSQYRRGDTFIQIRMRELFEGYKIDHGDPYFIGLMGQGGFERDFLLWHDAELREELIWPLFSLEGTQVVSFANLAKYSSGWTKPLVALVNEGMIDRERLLDEMLKALNRGFPAYRVRWFTQHYEDFAPTKEETTTRQHLLIAAMGSGVGSTVTFAVKQLSRLTELDQDGFVAAASHALGGTKGTAITALKMLEKIAAERDDLAAGIADAAQTGLYHSHDDVVRRSAELLRTLERGDLVDAVGDTLSPAMAKELLGDVSGDTAPPEPDLTPALEVEVVQAEPVEPFTDDNAVYRTRELLADPDSRHGAVTFTQLVAWLAATGPRALEVLKPVMPKFTDLTDNRVRWLLWNCAYADKKTREHTGPFSGLRHEEVLEPVIEIVRGNAPTRTVLSTPTDTFGRVDETELQRRLATYDDPTDAWEIDAILARIRSSKDPQLDQANTDGLPDIYGWMGSPAASALVTPESLDAFTQAWWESMSTGMSDWPESTDALALDVLTWHPGPWSAHTARFLGAAASNTRAEVRSAAAELIATRLANEIDAATIADQWATVFTEGDQWDYVRLGRWASTLSDAASISPSAVRDILDHLLPQLDRKARDLGKLLELYRNLRLQAGARDVDKRMREWLEGFTGSSKAAKAAKAILKET